MGLPHLADKFRPMNFESLYDFASKMSYSALKQAVGKDAGALHTELQKYLAMESGAQQFYDY